MATPGGGGGGGGGGNASTVVLVTAGYDHRIRFWEAPTGVSNRYIKWSDTQVNCLEIAPDKLSVAAGGNPALRLFDVATCALLVNFEGHSNNVTQVGFQQKTGSWMYSGSEDGTVKIWDPRSHCPTALHSYDGQSGAVNTVALHPNQAILYSGHQAGNIRVWDLRKGACSAELVPEGDTAISSIAVAPDGSALVAGNNDAHVFVWDPANPLTQEPEPVLDFQAHDTYLLKCVMSPNSSQLVTTSADKTAKVWNTSTWELDATLAQHQRWVWDAVFSADGCYLVTASSDHSAKLWDLRAGEVVQHYAGHNLPVTCVALNDRSFSTSSSDTACSSASSSSSSSSSQQGDAGSAGADSAGKTLP